MATITETDIIAVVEDFNTNIPDRLVTPHITKSKDLDFTGVLPQSLLDAVFALDLTAEGNTELKAFYNNYFKTCWVYRFYARFLSVHGKNVTHFGIVNVTDQDTIAVPEEGRAQLVANINRDASVYFTRMVNRYVAMDKTFDGTAYPEDDNYAGASKTKKFHIKAIGA